MFDVKTNMTDKPLSRNALIENTFSLTTAPIRFLLLLRIIVDIDEPGHYLETDIHDLSVFPERLEGSYRNEWQTYIRRQLHTRAFAGEKQTDAANLSLFFEAQYAQHAGEIEQRLARYMATVDTALAMTNHHNVHPIPSPLKRHVESLLKA